ncbi:MAG: hypothetical protein MUF62_10270, partial [Chitinophagaceae bacterium]|nr:hypothetical protein [Chitinophagaceae bacterium]
AEVRQQVRSAAPQPVQLPGKLFYKDGYVFLNEIERGVHIIDVRNVYQPRVVSFVAIPGCIDLAVRGNILYADLDTDLIAIDISNPLQVQVTKILSGVFPHRFYGAFVADSSRVIIDWERVDTTVQEVAHNDWGLSQVEFDSFAGGFASRANSAGTGSAGTKNGTGGSMARFALADDRLYTVSNSDIKVFNTSNEAQPVWVKNTDIGAWDIETIFPYKNRLFIGSQTGMYIYDISSKDDPKQLSRFAHARVCDPVVADDKHAYVTLRNGTQCGGFINQLDVVNIESLTAPWLVKSYPMTNPHGLAADGQLLLICDGRDGLRILDMSDKQQVRQLGQLTGVETYDVIALGHIALVSTTKALLLVDYSNPARPVVTASINTGN